jgi:hypothetical protein
VGSGTVYLPPGNLTKLENIYVRSTRFATISSGTSGAITLPSNSIVVLDDFGGTTDAVVSTLETRPALLPVYTAGGVLVATTFDADGNYVLSNAPASYPIALIYRVQQLQKDFDSTSANIISFDKIYD